MKFENEEKNRRKCNEKGITLIALAITIVVLIILAGVSINAVVGDDGIIKKAKESANLTKESEAKEIINRAVLEFRLTEGYDTLEDFLKTKVSAGTIDSVINNGDGTLNVSKNGYTLTVENKKKSSSGTSSGDNAGENTGGETQNTEITVSGIKVVADRTGTGSAITEADSVYLGNTLYITFSHSITGGTTTVDKTIPYAVTKNGTYTFTVTGTVNGKSYTKNVSVTVNQFKDVYELKYSDGIVYMPEGFKIAKDSASTVQGGVVIEDKDGNQFVWVPVATIADYKRTWYTGWDSSFSEYSETLPEDEKTSVERYKGFYIGRYEAGDKESTGTTKATFRTSSSNTSNSVTIKADQVPYNYVTRTQAISLAEGFATKQGYKAKTKLVSSYAWDTTIAFIEKTVNNYGSSSSQGNYKDKSVTYKDITDESKPEKTKAENSSLLVATGQTTPVCNIYDMGGNVFEWTTESCLSMSTPYAMRGGYYGDNFADNPAGGRSYFSVGALVYLGFRLTLFM